MKNTNFEEYLRDRDWRHLFMTLRGNELKKEISFLSRKQIISWLEWEDPHGVYSDADSRREFGSIMSRREGAEIMTRHIKEEYINSYVRIVANAAHEFFEKQINPG